MIYPGSRVMVFDHRLYRDDVSTPLSVTMEPATVVCRYGRKWEGHLGCFDDWLSWNYSDLVDVRFDHRPWEISKGHFTEGVTELVV